MTETHFACISASARDNVKTEASVSGSLSGHRQFGIGRLTRLNLDWLLHTSPIFLFVMRTSRRLMRAFQHCMTFPTLLSLRFGRRGKLIGETDDLLRCNRQLVH